MVFVGMSDDQIVDPPKSLSPEIWSNDGLAGIEPVRGIPAAIDEYGPAIRQLHEDGGTLADIERADSHHPGIRSIPERCGEGDE